MAPDEWFGSHAMFDGTHAYTKGDLHIAAVDFHRHDGYGCGKK